MGLRDEDGLSPDSSTASLTPRSASSGSAWGASSSCSTGTARSALESRDRADILQKFFRSPKQPALPGSFARAVYLKTGFVCAVRTQQDVGRLEFAATQREVAIVRELGCRSVQSLFSAFRTGRHAHLIGEFCAGGRLADRLRVDGDAGQAYLPQAEPTVARLLGQLLSTVEYMHGKGVCHRDISLEHLLLTGDGPLAEASVKLTGFGQACYFDGGEVLTERVGAEAYRAPEVWAGAYTNLADIWSCGIVGYLLLCGSFPFGGASGTDAQPRMGRRAVVFPAGVSAEARGVVGSLLKATACFRPPASDVLAAGWVQPSAAPARCGQNREEEQFCEGFRDALAWMSSSCDAEARPSIQEGENESYQGARDVYMTLAECYCDDDGPLHEFRQPFLPCLLETSGQAKADAGYGPRCGQSAKGPPSTQAGLFGGGSPPRPKLPATGPSHLGLVSL